MSLEDRFAIIEQLGRYSYADDSEDADAYSAMFMEDGVFEVYTRGSDDTPRSRFEGRAAIREWALSRYAGLEGAQRHHQTGTVFEELRTDNAQTRTMLLSTVQGSGDREPRTRNTGEYRDRWVKTDRGWLFQQRSLYLDHT